MHRGRRSRGLSLSVADDKPWSTCRRPWSLMYFTAHGRALPCCIAPFSARGYDSYTLGDATQQTLREIWNGAEYHDSAARCWAMHRPSRVRAVVCGGACNHRLAVRVAVVIPTLNEAETIAGTIAMLPRDVVDEIIVADSASRDGTPGGCARGGCARCHAHGAWIRACLRGRRDGGWRRAARSSCSWMGTGPIGRTCGHAGGADAARGRMISSSGRGCAGSVSLGR